MHIIQNRLLEHLNTHHSKWIEPENTKQLTILYNMADIAETSDYWNPSLLAQSLLGISFAASHQPWMNLHFIILEMCVRKECQAAIRRELEQSMPLDYKRLEQLPLLDSFIKETLQFAGRHWSRTHFPMAPYRCQPAQQYAHRLMTSCITPRCILTQTPSKLHGICQMAT